MSASALSVFRELERHYAHSAAPSPSRGKHVMYWVGTHLSIAGVSLLVGAGELDEIIETPAVTRIPGTKPWVLGLAAHKGGLLPVFSGDILFRRQPYSGRPREYCMVVRKHGLHFAMTLSGVYRDLKFPIEQRDMTQSIDGDFAGMCLGGFIYKEQFLAVLDIDKLVTDSDLGSAAVTTGESNEDKNP
ncbi:chemotaxis protein CheW [Parahaliea aestuarii]|uniref:Chemotaxis protein CheW n=1 Tax=Parahaliea aestuarii TaxID=1852021 RepID=A0A5C8ZV65_9GAMM|nr:chemotaxis protein CheW [Parahaliea aestuarii]TXS92346.1 chemotaxis protein CheW [Parahaliea aestuarii]